MENLQEVERLFKNLKKDLPKEVSAFVNFGQIAKQNGVIDKKHKSLILVALAVASQCDLCIAVHIRNAVDDGASKEEILEAAMLSVVMGGGPSLMKMNIVYNELAEHFE